MAEDAYADDLKKDQEEPIALLHVHMDNESELLDEDREIVERMFEKNITLEEAKNYAEMLQQGKITPPKGIRRPPRPLSQAAILFYIDYLNALHPQKQNVQDRVVESVRNSRRRIQAEAERISHQEDLNAADADFPARIGEYE